jgi:hypothetical protein
LTPDITPKFPSVRRQTFDANCWFSRIVWEMLRESALQFTLTL